MLICCVVFISVILPYELVSSQGGFEVECYNDLHCSDDNICENSRCIRGCRNDISCRYEETCINRYCQNPCKVYGACAENAICKAVNHERVCTCAPGFTGNPNIRCTRSQRVWVPRPVSTCGPSERCSTPEFCLLFGDRDVPNNDAVYCEDRRRGAQRALRYCCPMGRNPPSLAILSGLFTQPMYDATTPMDDETTPMNDETTPMNDATTPIPDETTPMSTTTTPMFTTTTPMPTTTTPMPTTTTPTAITTPNNRQECGISIGERPDVEMQEIWGAKNATEGMFTWMVALLRRSISGTEVFECGAFLIDQRHLLTAAHCFRSTDPSRYGVRLGNPEWRLGRYYNISNIVIHPRYRRGYFFEDIAVLTLSQEVDDPNVIPVCLPDEEVSSMSLVNTIATIAGWGSTTYGARESPILKYFDGLPIISNSVCYSRLSKMVPGFERKFEKILNNGVICADFPKGGRYNCRGDSGGPLMVLQRGRYFAVGIVSFGYQCGSPEIPAGYTRISEYMDFIARNTEDS